ncbi:MAG: DNA helicase RecQ [Bacteroidales bacterium]|nr:DNA helicase RecQ [Bacteroidales bacterium]
MDAREEKIYELLKKYFGFSAFKGLQKEVILSLLDGKDSFVLMPTGGGKSLCYQLPALMLEGTAIIISPLIALMKNQVDAMRGFSMEDGVAHFLNSTLSKQEVDIVKDDILSGKTKLLYVAPESLTKAENVEFLKKFKISFYAVDEAHCISEWGHDFRPEYRRIRSIVNEIGRAPLMTLTATATPKVQHDIQKNLDMLDACVFKSSFRRPNLYYEVRPKINATKQIVRYIKDNPGKSGIIYCLSRQKVVELAEQLCENGIKALPYHAGLDAKVRSENQDKFLNEEVDVIVATIAFGMGIDKPDVRFVIHYNMPKSLEGYYQETGRAGRDGGEGKCIAFYTYDDIQKLEKFIQNKPMNEQEIGKQLIGETVSYAESTTCRVRQLLNYFGEEMEEDCGNCDNCLNPKEHFDGKEDIVIVLETILAAKEGFKAEHIINVIMGKESAEISTYQHDKLPTYGIGAEEGMLYWKGVIRQSIIANFIQKGIVNYGLLKLTDKGRDFMKNPYTVMITRDTDYEAIEDMERDSEYGGTAAADEELYAMLKGLRKDIAKRYGYPPYVIFDDHALQDMSTQYPTTIDELRKCQNVGQKADKYGKEFCELIKRHVEENEIIRPDNFMIKSTNKNHDALQSILKNIDYKVMLDDIARSRNMEMSELINELKSIVSTGRSIDIDYYLENILDKEDIEDICEFFHSDQFESEQQTLEMAFQEFGDSYEEDEITLVYLKFISDVGK